jgi:hypothetical protein
MLGNESLLEMKIMSTSNMAMKRSSLEMMDAGQVRKVMTNIQVRSDPCK